MVKIVRLAPSFLLIQCCPANIYLFKVTNKTIEKRCKICSKLTIKTPKRPHGRCSGVFIINFELVSHIFHPVFLLMTLNKCQLVGCNFTCSFLVSTPWCCFFRLGTTSSQGQRAILNIFKHVKYLFYFFENIASLNNFCHWLQV